MDYFLSKSKVIYGIQCPKRLYLEVHQPELAEYSDRQNRIISQGEKVGEVARQLFPDGKLIAYRDDLSEAIEETHFFLQQSPSLPVYEATFSHQGVLVRSDIISRDENGLRLIEVKSSTSVKDYHLWDCAVQAWVIEGSGYDLDCIEVAYVNNSFVYPGNGNYQGLFTHEDVTNKINPLRDQVPSRVDEFKALLQKDVPVKEVGNHCNDPFTCPFQSHCFPDPPEYPVGCLPWVSSQVKEDLKAKGIDDIRQIPIDYLNNPLHEKIRRLTLDGKSELNPEAGVYLGSLPYPRYYLDFETIQFTVPIWAGTRPYQQLPFQWSCHIETKPEELTHAEFLDISGQNPLRPLTEKLLSILGDNGPILVYSPFEKMVLNKLAKMFPDLEPRLRQLIDRLVDLLPLTRKNYYHPEMKGSWSLKAVLPTIVPDLEYADLYIQNGSDAQIGFLDAIEPNTSDENRIKLTNALLKYCERDTLALVKMLTYYLNNI